MTEGQPTWNSALPAGIHGVVLRGSGTGPGGHLEIAVVWADRAQQWCLRCGRGVELAPGCPVNLDTARRTTQLVEFQHGCGLRLPVDHRVFDTGGAAPGAFSAWLLQVAAELDERRQLEIVSFHQLW